MRDLVDELNYQPIVRHTYPYRGGAAPQTAAEKEWRRHTRDVPIFDRTTFAANSIEHARDTLHKRSW